MVWQPWQSPLFFVDPWIKLNQLNYRGDILVGALLPWAQKHFKKRPSRTLHHHMGPKKLGDGFRRMSRTSFPKRNDPLFSPDLNLLNFGISSYLETKFSSTHHQILKALPAKLQKEWAKVPKKVIRDTCQSFLKRLQLVIDADGGHIE